MNRVLLIAIFGAVALLSGCAVQPIRGPGNYRDTSMSFAIPAGWKVTMHGRAGGCGHALVEAPGEAVVFIQGVPLKNDPGLERHAREFSRSTDRHVPLGRITSGGFRPFSDKRYGAGLKEPFTIALLGVEVPHTRFYRRMAGVHCAFYLLTQVADEDAAAAEPGFREILASFSPAER